MKLLNLYQTGVVVLALPYFCSAAEIRWPMECRFTADKSRPQTWQNAGKMSYDDNKKLTEGNAHGAIIYNEGSPKSGICVMGGSLDEKQNFTFTFYKQTASSGFSPIDNQSCAATGKNLRTEKIQKTMKSSEWTAVAWTSTLNNENTDSRLAVYLPQADDEVDMNPDKVCPKILEQMNNTPGKMNGTLVERAGIQ
jgi:hypothetical protein